MADFKNYMRSHFAGCRLLHQGMDPHRKRPARYFAMPGEFGFIGYSDDTDSFVIGSSNPHLPDAVRKGLAAIQAGEDFRFTPKTIERKRLTFPLPAHAANIERKRLYAKP